MSQAALDREASAILDEQPEVTPGAADSAAREATAAAPERVDKYGRGFDPRWHMVDGSGNPKLTKYGKLTVKPGGHGMPKGGLWGEGSGSAGGASASTVATPRSGAQAAHAIAPPPEPDYRATAEATVATITGLAVMFGGDRWEPVKQPDERRGMVEAWEGYYRARGIAELPPELFLALSMIGYAAPRALASPSFKALLARWGIGGARPDHRDH